MAARHRADIAALKRQVDAKGFASNRRRQGPSAADLGQLFGVSGQPIYLRETGRARPRAKHMPAVAALRTLGPKQAAQAFASLG